MTHGINFSRPFKLAFSLHENSEVERDVELLFDEHCLYINHYLWRYNVKVYRTPRLHNECTQDSGEVLSSGVPTSSGTLLWSLAYVTSEGEDNQGYI